MRATSAGILFTLSVSVGVTMIGLGIIWPLIPVYAVQMGAGGFMVGMIIASFNISKTLFSPFSGKLSDRFGRKNFIALGLFLYAVISLLYVLPENAWPLISVRFLHGVAALLVVPIALALAADVAPSNELGKYMGTLNMSVMLGLGIGPALGGVIKDHLGMNAAFYIMGALALLACILVVVFIPTEKGSGSAEKTTKVVSIRRILSNKAVMGIFLMRFFAASGQGAVYTFLPILALRMDLTGSKVGFILGANILIIALLQRYFGRVADRYNPKYMIITGSFFSGLTVLGMPFVEGFAMILLLNILMGTANGFSMPGGLVITGQLGKTMGMASLMSITDAAWSMGMIFSPILSGIILDLFGVSHVFVIGSILILIGSGAATAMLWDYRPQE